MAAGFKEMDGITADLGIEAWGETLEEAFVQTGLGLASIIADLPEGDYTEKRSILVHAPTPPDLLVKFLNEIIYREETEHFLPHKILDLKIVGNQVTATLVGVIFDPSRHTINTHVKAATYHELTIDESPEGVRVKVIFDI